MDKLSRENLEQLRKVQEVIERLGEELDESMVKTNTEDNDDKLMTNGGVVWLKTT
jgi:hypothetical protein